MTRPSRAPAAALFFSILALIFALGALTVADGDLWGHVRFGLDALRDRSLPSVDPYSFTQDRPWINHEWLSELFMGVAFAIGGAAGVPLLKGLFVLALFLALWPVLRAIDVAPRMVVIAVAALGTLQITQMLRPQLWSLVLMALLVRALAESWPRLWLLPLFVVWANAHGGWFVGLIVVAVWSAAMSVRDRRSVPYWLTTMAMCTAATLVTPYGWQLWHFLLTTVRTTRPMIEEWQPLWSLSFYRWVPWLMASGALVWSVSQTKRPSVPAILVLAVLAFGGLRVVRVTPLFVVAALVLLAPIVAARWPSRRSLTTLLVTSTDRAAAVVIAVVLAAVAAGVGARAAACVASGAQDVEARVALQSAQPGRLVTFFNYGEYAIWHLAPGLKVSMDGRRETVYSNQTLDGHDAILCGTPAGFTLLAQWRAQYVWLPISSRATQSWLRANGYRVDVETNTSFVAVRSDLPVLHSTVGAASHGTVCFPD